MDDAPRRAVDDPARDVERIDRRCPERQVDQRMRGLGGIAVLPVRFADPVAELQAVAAGVESGAADEGAGVGKRQRIDAARTAFARGSTARRRGPPPRRRGAACAPASRRRGGCWRAQRARGYRPRCGGRSTSRSVTRTGQSIARLSSSLSSFSATMSVPPGRKKGRWRPISPDPFPGLARHRFPRWGAGVVSRGTGYSAASAIGLTDT